MRFLGYLVVYEEAKDEDRQVEEEEGEAHHHSVDEGTPMFVVSRSNYIGVFGTNEVEDEPANGNGSFYFLSNTRFADITDGLSNTLLVGERGTILVRAQ